MLAQTRRDTHYLAGLVTNYQAVQLWKLTVINSTDRDSAGD